MWNHCACTGDFIICLPGVIAGLRKWREYRNWGAIDAVGRMLEMAGRIPEMVGRR